MLGRREEGRTRSMSRSEEGGEEILGWDGEITLEGDGYMFYLFLLLPALHHDGLSQAVAWRGRAGRAASNTSPKLPYVLSLCIMYVSYHVPRVTVL